ncbi:hypothetical protein [Saccharothrix deserti]|uniref:hypothetical protein n=1 Tax=Saccharothrix deserti TaxID=2593674 RepID=UPI003084597B
MALVTACAYVTYLVIILGPLAEMPYVAALLWTVGVAIAVTIVLSTAAELTTPKDSREKGRAGPGDRAVR